MRPGDVIADRFEILRRAGAGGMGEVFLARDRRDDAPVALKRMRSDIPCDESRFRREAIALASLDHPGLVAHVDHGLERDGSPYLVMEWLEGTTLKEVLAERRLSAAEVIQVGAQVALALDHAHGRGLVHRDLKPSNVFLQEGSLERVKIIDFGIVRLEEATVALTASGELIGTPAYMSPEQARGEAVDRRSDVYSLGCVLYRCLAGESVYPGAGPATVLLRVVLEPLPSFEMLRRQVPAPLADLVEQMLAKSPDHRPDTAAGVAERLAAAAAHLSRVDAAVSPAASPTVEGKATRVGLPPVTPDAPAVQVRCLLLARVPSGATEELPWRQASSCVAEQRGRLRRLVDGTAVATFSDSDSPVEQASRAARTALALRQRLPSLALSLAATRAATFAVPAMGEMIQGGVDLLSVSETAVADAAIRLDFVAAGLLDRQFVVRSDSEGLCLLSERAAGEPRRTLVGVATPCVGRDEELGRVDPLLQRCFHERTARAVLLLGPAGGGKSRLRTEILRRTARRYPHAAVWVGRADPVSARSPFGVIASAVRWAMGLLGDEPPAGSRQRLRARVERTVPPADGRRVAEFLGELVGVAPEGGASAELRAARLDMRLMSRQVRRACADWVRAECDAHPVLLVLEDLHWADRTSMALAGRLLERLVDGPLFVLGCARPELDEAVASLWPSDKTTPIELPGLSREASQELVHHALGPVDDDACRRLVALAAGNPLHLEELIRAYAAHREPPAADSMRAMVHARFGRLDAPSRQILRAASVFGRDLTLEGVASVVSDSVEASDVESQLEQLAADEWLTHRPDASYPGCTALSFRHVAVREAVYESWTAEDRSRAHRRAAAWLERRTGVEPRTLAEHYERGGQPGKAVSWYRAAAEQALEGEDLTVAVERADRGIACGASWETLGVLLRIQAEAARWQGDNAVAESKAREAMRHMVPQSDPWCQAAQELALAAGRLGHHRQLGELGRELVRSRRRQSLTLAKVAAWSAAAIQLVFAGEVELADELLGQLDEESAGADPADEAMSVRVELARAVRAMKAGDPAQSLELLAHCGPRLERLGDVRGACLQRANLGYAYVQLGDYSRGEEQLRLALEEAERLGLEAVGAAVRQNLCLALGRQGRLQEARDAGQQALDQLSAQRNRRMLSACHYYLALVLLEMGELEGAGEHASAAADAAPAHAERACALAVAARIGLAAGQLTPAFRKAHEARLLLRTLGSLEEGEALVRLTYAEALRAEGRRRRALQAIVEARGRLMERAERIADPEWRRRFLEEVPDNARTLELASEWLAEQEAE